MIRSSKLKGLGNKLEVYERAEGMSKTDRETRARRETRVRSIINSISTERAIDGFNFVRSRSFRVRPTSARLCLRYEIHHETWYYYTYSWNHEYIASLHERYFSSDRFAGHTVSDTNHSQL